MFKNKFHNKLHNNYNQEEESLSYSNGDKKCKSPGDDYEFLEDIDFLKHIDISHRISMSGLVEDVEENEEEEITIKIDFLEDLTIFDELDYFDELNKTLENEIQEFDQEIEPRVKKFLCFVKHRRTRWVSIFILILMFLFIFTGIYLLIKSKEQYTFMDTSSSNHQLTIGKVIASTVPTEIPTVQPMETPKGSKDDGVSQSDTKPEKPITPGNNPVVPIPEETLGNGDTIDEAKDFLKDAVFIGNSLTLGLQRTTGLASISFLAEENLSVSAAFHTAFVREKGSKQKQTILESLGNKTYKKVYIMFGINELGWPSAVTFGSKYAEFVREVQILQPGAQIYIQSILPVSKEKSSSSKIYNSTNIETFNEELEKVADNLGVSYLNVASALKDKDGFLEEGASVDGVHLKRAYCEKWLSYIVNNS